MKQWLWYIRATAGFRWMETCRRPGTLTIVSSLCFMSVFLFFLLLYEYLLICRPSALHLAIIIVYCEHPESQCNLWLASHWQGWCTIGTKTAGSITSLPQASWWFEVRATDTSQKLSQIWCSPLTSVFFLQFLVQAVCSYYFVILLMSW